MSHDRNRVKERLRAGPPRIFPALLQCDFSQLTVEIRTAQKHGAEAVHWDVMDGHFVPNLTYGPVVIDSLRKCTNLLFDAHLMVECPERLLEQYIAAGCDIITVHLEACQSPAGVLRAIRAAGVLAGMAVNPTTPVERIRPWFGELDLVLIMSVMPGMGGQSFDPIALPKLDWVRKNAPSDMLIEVDGGINRSTLGSVVEAGAQLLVVGSAYFGSKDRQAEFQALSNLGRALKPLQE